MNFIKMVIWVIPHHTCNGTMDTLSHTYQQSTSNDDVSSISNTFNHVFLT